jgi:tripartite-type tricarboxylate transporter receptor subunit TctC
VPEVKERLIEQGAETGGDTPEQFAEVIKADLSKWAALIKERGITVD